MRILYANTKYLYFLLHTNVKLYSVNQSIQSIYCNSLKIRQEEVLPYQVKLDDIFGLYPHLHSPQSCPNQLLHSYIMSKDRYEPSVRILSLIVKPLKRHPKKFPHQHSLCIHFGGIVHGIGVEVSLDSVHSTPQNVVHI
jgi:hypothetical protein